MHGSDARLDGELRRGFARGELVSSTNQWCASPRAMLVGFEALARWRHADRGALSARALPPARRGYRSHRSALGPACSASSLPQLGRVARSASVARLTTSPSRSTSRSSSCGGVLSAEGRRGLLGDRCSTPALRLEITEATMLDPARPPPSCCVSARPRLHLPGR